MSEHSPRLDLPYIQPAQAQKHVTVNEAFERLDALTQLVVQAFNAQTPPPIAEPGQIWALGAAPTDAWAAQAGHLAVATPGNGWLFILPETGWRAFGIAENELRIFSAPNWVAAQAPRADMFGVNTDASAGNRLSVMAPATLLTHEGAGHQLKINKAGVADTASLLFQTNWAGHAEMGLAGANDFAIKVSPYGSAWATALSFDAATGLATGASVQSTPMDTTSGRLMTTGAFGLGQAAGLPNTSFDDATAPGFYAGFAGAHASPSAGDNPFPTQTGEVGVAVVQSGSGWLQLAGAQVSGAPRLRLRSHDGTSASDWTHVVTSANAGAPIADGGVVERTDGANGSVVKYADGTQVCTIKRLQLTQRAPSNCHASWSFPAAFAQVDELAVSAGLVPPADADDPGNVTSSAAPGPDMVLAPSCGDLSVSGVDCAVYRVSGTTDFSAADTAYVSITAIGRWM